MLKVRDRSNFGVKTTAAARDALVESDEGDADRFYSIGLHQRRRVGRDGRAPSAT